METNHLEIYNQMTDIGRPNEDDVIHGLNPTQDIEIQAPRTVVWHK